MWFKFRAAFGSCWSVLDCDVIIHNQGSVLSGFLNTRKLVKARDRRRSAFMLFFVVFLLNWFLKRVYFIISKIKNNNRKNITHVFIFAFYYCIITCAYLPVSVMKCIFVLFQPEQVSHKLKNLIIMLLTVIHGIVPKIMLKLFVQFDNSL